MNTLMRVGVPGMEEVREFLLLALIKQAAMSSLDAWRMILKGAPKSQMRALVPASASTAMLCDLEQRTEPRYPRLLAHGNSEQISNGLKLKVCGRC